MYWKLGRVVDCTGLENRQTERFPGFESLSFRQPTPCKLHGALGFKGVFSEHPLGTQYQQVLTRLTTHTGIDLQFRQDVHSYAGSHRGLFLSLAVDLYMGGDFAISTLPCQAPCADALAFRKIQRTKIGVKTAKCRVIASDKPVYIRL